MHNLSFWVWPQFDLSSFVTICFFEFYHSLSSWVLPQLGFFFSFVTVRFFLVLSILEFFLVLSQFGFFSFVHNLSFQVLSQFEFLSFVTIWVLSFVTIFFFSFARSEFLNFVTFKIFVFGLSFSFWVLSQFEFLSFVTIRVFEFCHNLSLGFFFSQFEFSSCHNFFYHLNTSTTDQLSGQLFAILVMFGIFFLSCLWERRKKMVNLFFWQNQFCEEKIWQFFFGQTRVWLLKKFFFGYYCHYCNYCPIGR